ncbi:MAG: hypothetical protein PWP45_636 [Tepidanaerobacteraceae bacterium]|nr:hypothetical protein [Tepidanaerobacteraceae bacterium]
MKVNKRRLLIFSVILFIAVFAVLYGLFLKDREFKYYYDSRVKNVMETGPRYIIDVTFDPEKETVYGTQTVVFQNRTPEELSKIIFHIYPEAFKSLKTAPFPMKELKYAYPEGFSEGYINISDVKAGERKLDFQKEGTLLKVSIPEPLKPGEKIEIKMEFQEKLPFSPGRFGHGKNTYNFGNWYPVLCVYDENGWNLDPYYSIGDPFYSETASYDVSITAPDGFTIAATGKPVKKIIKSGSTTWVFEAELVRDFAWVAGSGLKVISGKVDGTKINVYYFGNDEDAAKKALEYGKQALRFFNRYFGPYPYDEYSIVMSDFYIGGMEYPNLVLIDHHLLDDEVLLEYVVVHETAHQWWYGLVGNNQVKEPWLDEAITEYSTVLYYEGVYGRAKGREIYQDFILYPYRFFELGNSSGPILRPVSQFKSWGEYDATVYKKGAIMLKELEGRVGKSKMRKALRLYLRQNVFGNATTDDFVNAVSGAMGTDFREVIYEMLKKPGRMEEEKAA